MLGFLSLACPSPQILEILENFGDWVLSNFRHLSHDLFILWFADTAEFYGNRKPEKRLLEKKNWWRRHVSKFWHHRLSNCLLIFCKTGAIFHMQHPSLYLTKAESWTKKTGTFSAWKLLILRLYFRTHFQNSNIILVWETDKEREREREKQRERERERVVNN